MNKKEPEKPILNQAAAKALTPVRIRKIICSFTIVEPTREYFWAVTKTHPFSRIPTTKPRKRWPNWSTASA